MVLRNSPFLKWKEWNQRTSITARNRHDLQNSLAYASLDSFSYG